MTSEVPKAIASFSGVDNTSQLNVCAASMGSGIRSSPLVSRASNQAANVSKDWAGPFSYQDLANPGNRSASPISILRSRTSSRVMTKRR